jgi:TRAP-type C4-dicarboxylate transport system substrate-binding protein
MDQLKDCTIITAKKDELYLKQVNNVDKLLLGNGLMISKISFVELTKKYNDAIEEAATKKANMETISYEEALNDYIKDLEQAMIVMEKEEVSQ